MGETLNPLEYYARPGEMSDPKIFSELFDELPTDIGELCAVVQGVLVHVYFAKAYGATLSEERERELQIRPVSEQLARIREMEKNPLTVRRDPDKRLICNCRDLSLMLCSMPRRQGVPARARCGFGAYFNPGKFEDHWICEYWSAAEERWLMVDAQIDSFQQKEFDIRCNLLDLTTDQFLSGAEAWRRRRRGEADPDLFGIRDMRGFWFIRGNLVRDLASLNKMELLCWDLWGIIEEDEENITEDDRRFLDGIAELILSDNIAFPELRATYEGDPRLRVPPVIRTFLETGVQTVDLSK